MISTSKLKSILDGFSKKKILILGDIGIDRYTEGDVERISPEAPVPILAVKEERLKLGLAANVADNVRELGGEALLCGVLGKDRAASDFRALLKGAKIATRCLVTDSQRRTSLKERVVTEQQQLLRVDYETLAPISAAMEKTVLAQLKRAIRQADVLIIEDYAKGLLSKRLLQQTVALARAAEVPAFVDPNLKTPVECYSGATVLTPNRKEAEFLAQRAIRRPKDLEGVAAAIFEKTGCKSLFITLGKDGMAVFESGRAKGFMIPTYAREVYDVSGAGDTVIAALALATAAGASLKDAAIVANLAAGVEVGKRGTAVVSRKEIVAFARRVGQEGA